MKNTCFFNSTSFWGGGEKSHLEYASNFQRRNYQVCLVTSSGSELEKRAQEQAIPVFGFRIGKLSFLNPFMINKLARFFRSQQIDTVFLNSSADLKIGGLAARKARVKNIVYMRGLAVPVKNSWLNRYLLTRVVTHPVPNSEDTKKMFLQKLSAVLPPEHVPVIYRGINFDDWDKRAVNPHIFRENDELILGNVGRLVKQKGQDFLIDVARELKQKGLRFKLVIAGVGPLEQELKTKALNNGLEKEIIFPGFYKNIRDFLAGIDVFLFPSLWEGFGNAMVEAMYEKKPVVAFNLTSNPEIIQSGENGFLVDYPKLDDFVTTILKLAQDEKLRQHIGEEAHQSVKGRFSFDRIIQDLEKLLD